MTDPCSMSATALAKAIADKELTATAATEAVLARIKATDRHVNAFITLDEAGALKAAAAADAAPAPTGPLHGVPFTVKDLISTKGLRTTLGSVVFKDNVSPRDAAAVTRLKNAGAILIGKTTTPEFGHRAMTDSPLFGVTRNPWDTDLTAGGSSGGAGAAVSLGMGPLALVTDGGGSARIPAACCGVVGLKPTLGRIPYEQEANVFAPISQLGLMTRTIADLALMLGVTSGAEPGDPWSRARGPETFPLPADPAAALRGKRIGWLPRMGNELIDHEIERSVTGALSVFQRAGATIVDLHDRGDWGEEAGRIIMRSGQVARYAFLLDHNAADLDIATVRALEEGLAITTEELRSALITRSDLYIYVVSMLDGLDAMITPTLAAPPLAAEHASHMPLRIGNQLAGTLRQAWYSYTHPFNLSGHPALALPCGFDSRGLPIGMQLVGHWWDEQTLIDLAAAFEAMAPWADRWPDLVPKAA